MQGLLLISSVTLAVLSWPCIRLAKNYIKARKIGLPILITPINSFNFIWQLGNHRIAPLLRALPFGLGNFVDHTGFAWYFPDRYRSHARLGPAFCVVSPGELQIILAEPDTVDYVLARRKEFQRDEAAGKPLEIFGPNVLSARNDTWQRQRRITTQPFNERNNGYVWREALAQSTSMLKTWVSKGNNGVEATPNDTMTLTLHVLIAAGLGKTYEFDGGTTDLVGDHKISYRDALKLILYNFPLAILMGSISLPMVILPRKLREVKTALKEFGDYMKEMMEENKKSLHKIDEKKDNLMTTLLRASESRDGSARNGLSDEEIIGNLFIYNIAGHDTTAMTLAYCIILISVEPEIQEWIKEEIQSVFGLDSDVKDWEYEKAFPRLKRCFALMNETLRLYGPAVASTRYTADLWQTINIEGKNYSIPPQSYIALNMGALNTLPKFWGSDSLTWRPYRWITKDEATMRLEDEQIYQPQHHAFIPFSSGPRMCPGKKFAQVEFVAVIARLFRRHRCSPVLLEGETMVEAKKRILEIVEDSNLVLTLKMHHPERVKLTWEEIV